MLFDAELIFTASPFSIDGATIEHISPELVPVVTTLKIPVAAPGMRWTAVVNEPLRALRMGVPEEIVTLPALSIKNLFTPDC